MTQKYVEWKKYQKGGGDGKKSEGP